MIKSRSIIFCLWIFFLVITATSCARKKIPSQPESQPEEVLADLKTFPQNLEVYAKMHHPDKRLLSRAEQEDFARRFRNIYFGPWEMSRTTVKKKDVSLYFKRARGYKADGSLWQQHEWDALAENANLDQFPSSAKPAITLHETDLRELPVSEIRLDKQENIKNYPFDYFQYSRLAPGMPLLIAHATRDGGWLYAECPIASGWVNANDVGFVTREFIDAYRGNSLAALVKDNVGLPGIREKANVGAVFPLLKKGQHGKLTILAPIKNSAGAVVSRSIDLPQSAAVEMPYAMTAGNVAEVGNQLLGQKYGWGGTLGYRDCSAAMRDLFTPFGIWLPRNSVAQARRGSVISLQGMSPAEKKTAILENGVPFLSLLGMAGHIGLYVGAWKGEPAMFHNAWGIRIVKDGNDDERFVIGKAVVTSIMPGKELKNLYLPRTFTDRLRSLTRIGGSGN